MELVDKSTHVCCKQAGDLLNKVPQAASTLNASWNAHQNRALRVTIKAAFFACSMTFAAPAGNSDGKVICAKAKFGSSICGPSAQAEAARVAALWLMKKVKDRREGDSHMVVNA